MNLSKLFVSKSILAVTLFAFSLSAIAQIEEIVVTARKKSESLQDIPVQVDVLTAQEIARKGITSLQDISKMSSALVFDNGFTQSDTRISLRGLSPIRGRQNVANYLTKELKIDWRIGAEYFESLLIDYDVHSNYGNWLYNAGIGNDSMPFRKFNPKLQSERYDPKKIFEQTWLNE